jgi:hypothetical protein
MATVLPLGINGETKPFDFVEPDQPDLGCPVLFPKIFPFPPDPNQFRTLADSLGTLVPAGQGPTMLL